jgi:hypothetical protein
LVGVSLDLDSTTHHKPEFVRIFIGCRGVDLVPCKAEGFLGDNFYDFYYDVDKVVVARPPKKDISSKLGNSSKPPSHKGARCL